MRYNLLNMKGLDIFTSNLNAEDYNSLISSLPKQDSLETVLLSWGLKDLFEGSDEIKDLYAVKALANNYKWNVNVSQLLKQHKYQSLVITDADKNIIWVNDGFSKMTGYSKEFAINKTPRFLQGKATSERSRGRIRNKLLKGEPFKDIVINYRKDKTEYKCELHVFPLYNNKTTHYIALEKEVI